VGLNRRFSISNPMGGGRKRVWAWLWRRDTIANIIVGEELRVDRAYMVINVYMGRVNLNCGLSVTKSFVGLQFCT
jgi:hypothetical protein